MSMLRHNVSEIILMVIVVILAQRLPCRASSSSSNKHGKRLVPWTHGRKLFGCAAPNDPSALFDELNRHRIANNFPKWHHLMRITEVQPKAKEVNTLVDVNEAQQLLLPLSLTATSNDVRQEEQRRRQFERLQNEAADREFEQIMRKLKMKLQRERDKDSAVKCIFKKDQHHKNFSNYCKKKKHKLKGATGTTTESPSTDFSTLSSLPTPPTTCPATTKQSQCNKQAADLKPEDVDRLLKNAMTMKRRALLILKHLNLLEMELLNRWPGGSAPPDECRPESRTTTSNPDPRSSAKTTDRPERIEKPTTQRPKTYQGGFHFGLRPPGAKEANIAAALREQRKLEQKVREEYQMQLERAEWQRHQMLKRLKSKRKRARFDAAPPAAVRLELMTTPTLHIVDNTKVIQKHPSAKHSSAAIKRLAKKVRTFADRNHIDLKRQPLHSWKIMRKFKRKEMNNLSPIVPEVSSSGKNIPVAGAHTHSRTSQRLH
ncbi:hypothetical protein KR093_001079 [Drosophila rubida]|uniref:Uncharacterized protein n=1 Tax=Drosophila rubida TaxID=30044 RepID=A0AAD4JXN9_9MUSC|nr:hypothetical protein KR093_001079 [Drosophila rubida]